MNFPLHFQVWFYKCKSYLFSEIRLSKSFTSLLHDFEIDLLSVIQNIQPSCFDIDLVNSSNEKKRNKSERGKVNASQIINVKWKVYEYLTENYVKPKWVEVGTEVETEAAIGVDRAKDVTKVAKSPEDLGDQDLVQDLDRERVHQNDIGMSCHNSLF